MTRVFRHYGSPRFDPQKFKPVKNRLAWVKPKHGLWASELTDTEKGTTAWRTWCEGEEFHLESFSVFFDFELAEDARLCVIDTFNDFHELLLRYNSKNLPEWAKGEGGISNQYLDFEALSKDYEVLELTDKGQHETRFSSPGLYGWDCASILVMNPEVLKPV